MSWRQGCNWRRQVEHEWCLWLPAGVWHCMHLSNWGEAQKTESWSGSTCRKSAKKQVRNIRTSKFRPTYRVVFELVPDVAAGASCFLCCHTDHEVACAVCRQCWRGGAEVEIVTIVTLFIMSWICAFTGLLADVVEEQLKMKCSAMTIYCVFIMMNLFVLVCFFFLLFLHPLCHISSYKGLN